MFTLFSHYNSYSMTAQVMLEELGLEYEIRWVKIHIPNSEKVPELMAANPNGRVPTLLTPQGPIYETAAILIHLAEQNPDYGLMPDIGTSERRLFWQWHFYLTSTLMPEELLLEEPHVYLPANAAARTELVAAATGRLRSIWAVLNDGIVGPYFLGDQYSTCDISFVMQALWPSCQPPEGLGKYPNARNCLKRVLDRTAAQKVLDQHGKTELATI